MSMTASLSVCPSHDACLLKPLSGQQASKLHGSLDNLLFWRQSIWRNSNMVTPNRGANTGRVGTVGDFRQYLAIDYLRSSTR